MSFETTSSVDTCVIIFYKEEWGLENYLKKNGIEIEKFYKEWVDRKPEILIDLPRNWYDKIKVQTTKK